MLARVAASHFRVGTFQFFAARGDMEAVRRLADHAIARHDPEAAQAANPYRAFLDGVIAAQARLVARWMGVGFIHGVMNTDNTSISGETIDYGPCAFMDAYDPAAVFSSIDRGGRYAYRTSPASRSGTSRAWRNACCRSSPKMRTQPSRQRRRPRGFRRRLSRGALDGLQAQAGPARSSRRTTVLVDGSPRSHGARTRRISPCCSGGSATPRPTPRATREVRDLFIDPTAFDDWAEALARRLGDGAAGRRERRAAHAAANPAFIPRNHRVEEVIAAAHRGRLRALRTPRTVLANPYEDQPDHASYAEPPSFDTSAYRTFCGT